MALIVMFILLALAKVFGFVTYEWWKLILFSLLATFLIELSDRP